MISIRQSLEEVELREERERLLRDCYTTALKATREYVVEVEPGQAIEFRQRIEAMEKDLPAARAKEDYQALQSAFRGELREYRDRSRELIRRLRNEVSAAATAMEALTNSVAANGAGLEADLNRAVTRLGQAASTEDLPAIRRTITSESAAIQQSFEQMQQRNQMVIAQLQDEIQSLHRAMESEKRILHTDAASGAWNQRKLAERFDQLLALNESFAVLLLSVVNWKDLTRQDPGGANSALKALVEHLKRELASGGQVGRWNDNVLAVIVESEPRVAESTLAGLVKNLAAGFSYDGPGALVALRIKFAVVGRNRGANAAEFYPALGQHVTALTAGTWP